MNRPVDHEDYQNPAKYSAKVLSSTGWDTQRAQKAGDKILERNSNLPPEVQKVIQEALGQVVTEMIDLDSSNK